jgi:ABC-type phosphate transport system substrate-binding protein
MTLRTPPFSLRLLVGLGFLSVAAIALPSPSRADGESRRNPAASSVLRIGGSSTVFPILQTASDASAKVSWRLPTPPDPSTTGS